MAKAKKLGLKERYSLMTRGLGWETSYQPMDEVFPYDTYEGIKIVDIGRAEDQPLCLQSRDERLHRGGAVRRRAGGRCLVEGGHALPPGVGWR